MVGAEGATTSHPMSSNCLQSYDPHHVHPYRSNGKKKLIMYDMVLRGDVADMGLDLVAPASGGCGNAFLDHVLIRELDENADGVVTEAELMSVQIKAGAYARLKTKDEAKWILNDWLEFLYAIFIGFDRESLLPPVASEQTMCRLEQRMQVKNIIQSYNISSMVSEYVEGTRQWLYNDVNGWLSSATATAPRRRQGCSCCWRGRAWARACSAP